MFLFDEHRRHLNQALTDDLTRLVSRLQILFKRFDMGKDFTLHADQQLAGAGAHDRIGRHQLRMREALVDIFVDDVRLIKDQVALDQHRHPTIRIDGSNVFRLGKQIDVDHLKIHTFLVENDTATLAERAGGARI